MGDTIKKLYKHYFQLKRLGAYGGAATLQHGTKLTLKEKKKNLSHQDTFALHKPVDRKFNRRSIITCGIDQQFQAYLVDLQIKRKYNDSFSYLVTRIDVFSKYACAIPIKTKTGRAITQAVSGIFKERKPINIQTDKGSEFVNRLFLKFTGTTLCISSRRRMKISRPV